MSKYVKEMMMDQLRADLDGSRSPEWIYLFDQPGGATRAAGETAPVIAAKTVAPKTATARR